MYIGQKWKNPNWIMTFRQGHGRNAASLSEVYYIAGLFRFCPVRFEKLRSVHSLFLRLSCALVLLHLHYDIISCKI